MRRGDDGFTLLEMLVALIVFGLVMAGISQTFRFGLAAWSAGPARSEAPENLAAMDAAVTAMVAQLVPGTLTGLPDQLSFVTRLPAGAGLQGALADAAIVPMPGGTLILRYRAHPAGVPLVPPPSPSVEILARGVTGFSVSYLLNGAPGWSHSCKPGRLPLLIRFHMDFADGRNWPDLIAAPPA